MQHKQRFTNVTLVTPYNEVDKDLLIEGDKIVDILNPSENISCKTERIFHSYRPVDGHSLRAFCEMHFL